MSLFLLILDWLVVGIVMGLFIYWILFYFFDNKPNIKKKNEKI